MDKPQKNINPDRPPQFFLNRDQILTLNDFLDFKAQLLYEIRQLVKEVTGRPIKQWLKSHEVKNCLNLDERPTDHAEQWYNPVLPRWAGLFIIVPVRNGSCEIHFQSHFWQEPKTTCRVANHQPF